LSNPEKKHPVKKKKTEKKKTEGHFNLAFHSPGVERGGKKWKKIGYVGLPGKRTKTRFELLEKGEKRTTRIEICK